MPKLLIIAATLVNYGDDRGGVDQAVGDIVNANKDTARTLAEADRALYVDEADDHSKPARYTASAAMVKAAEAAAKAAAKAAKEPAPAPAPAAGGEQQA